MAQHKWAKEIKAWADGVEIEDRVLYEGGYTGWRTVYDTPDWNNSWHEYRIKPQPKDPQYLYVYVDDDYKFATIKLQNVDWQYVGKIKLEVDDGN